jgi:hypothetical protein
VLRAFLRSERANLHVIFAISLVPLLSAVAGVVDYTDINRKADRLQNALDTAALEIGVNYYAGMSSEELEALGRKIFLANLAALEAGEFIYDEDDFPPFEAAADYGEEVDLISVTSTVSHAPMVGWGNQWFANRRSVVRVAPGLPACVLALDRSASPGIVFRGATDVEMKNCVVASNSRAANAVSRDGSARFAAECVVSSGGTNGIVASGNVRLDCQEPLTHQLASMDPLRNLQPPSYTACRSVPNGRQKTLSPGTFCGQTISGEVTLEPGVYILRGGRINLGGNGSLTGNNVTIFLMEDAEFSITANQTVQLRPPSSGPYAGITIYQPSSNRKQVTSNGGAGSFIDGFVYAPGAHVFFAGNADTLASGCLRIVGATIEMTGSSTFRSDCEIELGDRKMYATRMISLVR